MSERVDEEVLEFGGHIALYRAAVKDHDALLASLARELPLRSERLQIMGRDVMTPRLTSWHGDAGTSYRYSGRTFEPLPWTAGLAAVRDRVAELTALRFNSVLVNLYRDGRDSMGLHSDDERELGPDWPRNILIASVSLGARRRFVLKEKAGPGRRAFDLGCGDLLVMGGALQSHWQHGVPKTRQAVGPRMNLTFRIVGVVQAR